MKSVTQMAISVLERKARLCKDPSKLFMLADRLEKLQGDIRGTAMAVAQEIYRKFLKKTAMPKTKKRK